MSFELNCMQLRELRPFLDERLRLTALPAKNKKKLLAIYYLAGKIEPDYRYSEAEIGDLLDRWTVFHDPATLRRELYNKHLINRTEDGTSYWLEAEIPSSEDFVAQHI